MIERIQFPGLATGGFHEAPAAFVPFAPAIPVAEAGEASGDSRPLGESDRHALDIWRAYRAAQTRQGAADQDYGAALALVPPHLRPGRKCIGTTQSGEGEQEVSEWPAKLGVETPEYGRIVVRPDPEDLLLFYRGALGFALGRSNETVAERQARVFDRFAADVAALAERVNAQREARRAARVDELRLTAEAALEALFDARDAILALPCDCPHALAAVALIRMEDEDDADAPNFSFFRAILAGVRRELTGEIAEDVAAALARADEEEADEDEEEADEDEEEADENP